VAFLPGEVDDLSESIFLASFATIFALNLAAWIYSGTVTYPNATYHDFAIIALNTILSAPLVVSLATLYDEDDDGNETPRHETIDLPDGHSIANNPPNNNSQHAAPESLGPLNGIPNENQSNNSQHHNEIREASLASNRPDDEIHIADYSQHNEILTVAFINP
jgi:hypothetical protein